MRKGMLLAIFGAAFLLIVLAGCCNFSAHIPDNSGTTASSSAEQQSTPAHVSYEDSNEEPTTASVIEQCTPSWECSTWTDCSRAGLQERTCADASSCGDEISRPSETQQCTPSDQCSNVASRGSDLLSTCYRQKYYDIATDTNNASVCWEIVSPQHMGTCYASVALDEKNGAVCEPVEPMSYTATGYYDNLTSRDLCYCYYVEWMELNYLSFEGQFCDEIENLQLREECDGLDAKYYSEPASMALTGASKNSNNLTIQLKFNRAYGWTSSHYSAFSDLSFSETNLDGELTYSLNQVLNDNSGVCAECEEDFSSTVKRGSFRIRRSDFSLFSISTGNILLYQFQIPLDGLDIHETLPCTGVSADDRFECSISCNMSGEGQSCVDDCIDEHRDTEQCQIGYSVSVEIEGNDGSSFEDEKLASQIFE